MFNLLETLISFIVGIIEFFLGFRLLFKLFGANPMTPFVQWLYLNTEPLLNPFQNIFPSPKIEGGLVEFTTLAALVVYMFIGYFLIELVAAMRHASRRYRMD